MRRVLPYVLAGALLTPSHTYVVEPVGSSNKNDVTVTSTAKDAKGNTVIIRMRLFDVPADADLATDATLIKARTVTTDALTQKVDKANTTPTP